MAPHDEFVHVEEKEQRILAEEKKIEEAEKHIEKEEQRILHAEQSILKSNKKGLRSFFTEDLSPPERYFLRQRLLKRFAEHKLIFSLIFTIGVVLVWRGIWHAADIVFTPENYLISAALSFAVGLLILWLIDRYTDLNG